MGFMNLAAKSPWGSAAVHYLNLIQLPSTKCEQKKKKRKQILFGCEKFLGGVRIKGPGLKWYAFIRLLLTKAQQF